MKLLEAPRTSGFMKSLLLSVTVFLLAGCLSPVRDTDLDPKDGGPGGGSAGAGGGAAGGAGGGSATGGGIGGGSAGGSGGAGGGTAGGTGGAGGGSPKSCDTCKGNADCNTLEQCGTGGVSCLTCPCIDVCVPFPPVDGDAACDQSQCLPSTGRLLSEGAAQLVEGGDSVYALSYGAPLRKIAKANAAVTPLVHSASDPLDGSGPIKLRNGWAYYLTTWAGEAFGIPARVHLTNNTIQSLGPAGLSPNGVTAFDVDGNEYWFTRGGKLILWNLATLPATDSIVADLEQGETASDLTLTPTQVWWAGNKGLKRHFRTGGTTESMLAGTFDKLLVEGADVHVLGSIGGTRGLYKLGATPNTSTPVVVGDVSDFVSARGTLFYVVRTATEAKVYSVGGGAAVLTAPFSGAPNLAPKLAVDAQHVYLATENGVFYASSAQPVSTCGCAAPNVVLPSAPTPACSLNLCPATYDVQRGLGAGVLEGDTLFGVHAWNGTSPSRPVLKSTVSTGSYLAYSLTNAAPQLTADPTYLFVADSGDLKKVIRATGNVSTVLSNARIPYYGSEGQLMANDADRVYFWDSTDGIVHVLKQGGTRGTLVPRQSLGAAEPTAVQLILDNGTLYFTANDRLMKQGLSGGQLTTLATGVESAAGFALNATHVYFRTARGIERATKTNVGQRTLVLSHAQLGGDGHQLTHLSIEGRNLIGLLPPTSTGGASTLVRIDLGTGARQQVLAMSGFASGVVSAATGFVLSGEQSTAVRQKGCQCP